RCRTQRILLRGSQSSAVPQRHERKVDIAEIKPDLPDLQDLSVILPPVKLYIAKEDTRKRHDVTRLQGGLKRKRKIVKNGRRWSPGDKLGAKALWVRQT